MVGGIVRSRFATCPLCPIIDATVRTFEDLVSIRNTIGIRLSRCLEFRYHNRTHAFESKVSSTTVHFARDVTLSDNSSTKDLSRSPLLLDFQISDL
jgi:hypothetical protein